LKVDKNEVLWSYYWHIITFSNYVVVQKFIDLGVWVIKSKELNFSFFLILSMPRKKIKRSRVRNFCSQKFDNTTNNSGMIYVLGFFGALVYYITTATSIWMGVTGFLKAIVWPAFLVYGSLKVLGL
jgi:hypothetical protein